MDLYTQLVNIEELHQRREDTSYAERLQHIAVYQRQRAQQTYEDLLQQPRYRPAMQFLLDDVFGTPDHFERDCQMKRAYRNMIKLLPKDVVDTLTEAITLHALSMQLDHEMALHCMNAECALNSIEDYARLVAVANKEAQRRRQVELILNVGRDLDKLVKNRFVLTALKLARRPAEMAGILALHNYLEEGIAAFKAMKGAKVFMQAIQARETQWLDHVYTT